MILHWTPSDVSCTGGPETIAGYTILLMAVWIVGWYGCGEPPMLCPIYATSPWMEAAFVEEPEFDLMTLPTPPVGGFDIYRPTAVDAAGNTSGECLP